jgi:ribosomal protein S15P/S13E
MPNLNAAEATEQLARAITEAQRLGEHFAQRTKDEKKRMSQLQQLVPKLKRLARSQALDKQLSADEHKVLESLKPVAAAK